MSATPSTDLLHQARPLVAHLYARNPSRYWIDFLVCLGIAYPCAGYYLTQPLHFPGSPIALLIAGILIYRVSLFMHEIVHFHPHEMRGFQICWNLLAGIPLLIPSFFYEPHRDHHAAGTYGTDQDGEYLPLGHDGWWGLLKFSSEVFILPIYFVTRFLIGTPLSFLSPRLREHLLKSHSSFVIDLHYEREIRPNAPRTLWAWIEIACFLRIVVFLTLVVLELAPWTRIFKIYGLGVLILGTNHFRTLTAHRYRNKGTRISYVDQFLDSTNIEGNLFTELLCPLGLRYHALHHLLPRLPYYNLKRAHRLLSQMLPADSLYHQVTYKSCRQVLSEFLSNLGSPSQQGTTPGDPANRASRQTSLH